jgi:hypothetical protein
MKTMIILMASLVAGMAACGADDPAPELARVVASLQPIIATLSPSPEVKTNDAISLTILYRTQSFKVHGGQMTGEFAREAHDEIGPTFKGFILSIYVQPTGEVNQADTPCTLREPYWQTYLQVTPVGGSDKQLYWGLSFGSRTDTNVLARIRTKIEELRDKPNK